MRKSIENHGFTPPVGNERRTAAFAELIATLGLGVATIVTVIAVTAGVANADVVDGVVGNETSVFAIALILGLAFIGVGGLTLPGKPRRH